MIKSQKLESEKHGSYQLSDLPQKAALKQLPLSSVLSTRPVLYDGPTRAPAAADGCADRAPAVTLLCSLRQHTSASSLLALSSAECILVCCLVFATLVWCDFFQLSLQRYSLSSILPDFGPSTKQSPPPPPPCLICTETPVPVWCGQASLPSPSPRCPRSRRSSCLLVIRVSAGDCDDHIFIVPSDPPADNN